MVFAIVEKEYKMSPNDVRNLRGKAGVKFIRDRYVRLLAMAKVQKEHDDRTLKEFKNKQKYG